MLEIESHGDAVVELRMARPPVNALNPALLAALNDALVERREAARAIVLSGQPGMFTAGLDVPELLTLDREAMVTTWSTFIDLMRTLASSPVPVVSAITGHSPAGGAVLAVFTDYRVMAGGGRYSIGLNEVAVGLPVPAIVVAAFARLVGEGRAERLLSTSQMLPAEDALTVGLVDEVVDADEVRERAVAHAGRLAAMPPVALRETRRFCRQSLMAHFDALTPDLPERMSDVWFSEETQAAMRALIERLAKG
jgi:3,2-trans-enoyl-CoA isomerase